MQTVQNVDNQGWRLIEEKSFVTRGKTRIFNRSRT